jgi:hypothetical protein
MPHTRTLHWYDVLKNYIPLRNHYCHYTKLFMTGKISVSNCVVGHVVFYCV